MHIEIVDITGKHWIGDSADEPVTPAEIESIADLLKNFSGLGYLSLAVVGVEHYFNPAHIIAVSIHKGI